MKIQVETVSPVERKVTIEVDPDRVAKELERAYVGLGRRVKLRGFRPGKAPRKVLERHFRAEVESEVAEKIVQQTFAEAAKVESIDAVAPPHVSIAEGVAQGKPLRYTARVEVKPKLEPRDYRGLEVTHAPPAVTDETVEQEMGRLRESLAQLVPVEGRVEAQEGDLAVIDHEGTVDGQPFEGGRAEGVTVKVGPGPLTEGNFGALAGRRIGDTVDLEETLPGDHPKAELRGKVARMRATLKSLRSRRVPDADDALAKSLGIEGVETIDLLRARMRSDIERREKRRADAALKDAIVKAALGKNEFEVPSSLVERAIDGMIEGALERFAHSGIDVRQLGLDVAKMRADLREQALLQVRGRLLLDAIADAEKLDATEEEMEAEVARISEEVGVPLPKVRQQMRGKEAREALKTKVREDKALALMTSTATVKP